MPNFSSITTANVEMDDLIIEHLVRSGPGGQHRNRKKTAVRVCHIPSGICVIESRNRSQTQNLRLAIEKIEELLLKLMQKKKPRIKTKKTRQSQNKRIEVKKRRSKIKQLRKEKIMFTA